MSEGTSETQTDTAASEKPAAPRKTIFRDDHGAPSSMRVMSFIALLSAIGFGWVTINKGPGEINGIYITIGFLLAAFAPKALQKFAENKFPQS